MYFLDEQRGHNGAEIYRVKNNFDYPLHKDRRRAYKIRSGETLSVCMTSDFFLEEADEWRGEAWDIIRARSDVIFYIITKRPQRIPECLPEDWGDGWENVFMNVTAENQRRAEERVPLLLALPFKHKGVNVAPFIGEVSLAKWLDSGQIEQVSCGGENYSGARPCRFEWVQSLRKECVERNITFLFVDTGTKFIKDNKLYTLSEKRIRSEMASKSRMSFEGKPLKFKLYNECGYEITEDFLHKPEYYENCELCAWKPTCSGCSRCGQCGLTV